MQVFEAVVTDAAPDGAPAGHIKVYCPAIAGTAELPTLVAPLYPGWTGGGWQSVPQTTLPETDNDDPDAEENVVRVIILALTPYDLRWIGTAQIWSEIADNASTRCGVRSRKGHHKITIDDDDGVLIEVSDAALPNGPDKNSLLIGTDDTVTLSNSSGYKLLLDGLTIRLTNNVGPTQPPVMGTVFLTALVAAAAEWSAAAAAAGLPTVATAALIAGINTSLSSGAPYLSSIVEIA